MSHGTLFVCGNFNAKQATSHAAVILENIAGEFVGGATGLYFKLAFPNKKLALAAQIKIQAMGYEVKNWDEWVMMNASTTFARMTESKGKEAATAWLKQTFPKVAVKVLAAVSAA